jgi:hypothetical protein
MAEAGVRASWQGYRGHYQGLWEMNIFKVPWTVKIIIENLPKTLFCSIIMQIIDNR